MINLLQETLQALTENGKSESDVIWVGTAEGDLCCAWNIFKSFANFEYSEGYGGREIAYDLLVVGKDWWLERHEYDGSEWWEFKSLPAKPTEIFDNDIGSIVFEDKKSTIVHGELKEPKFKW